MTQMEHEKIQIATMKHGKKCAGIVHYSAETDNGPFIKRYSGK